MLVGLEKQIPDLQERINHIFTKQLYGIAITKLTSLLSRRSLYCSKTADGKYSICDIFKDSDGNIQFKNTKHTFKNHKCIYCGVSDEVDVYTRDDSLESHAYEFIHSDSPKEFFNMKFDVIIGNPPYQLATGGAQAQAIPLYHKFILQAKRMKPRYLSMIVPSRWFTGGFGLDSFRDEMLNDKSLRIIHDFVNASDCFTGVEIKGGVNYFLWDRDNKGNCKVFTHENGQIDFAERPLLEENQEVFIRQNKAISILRKVLRQKEKTFNTIVSSQRPFGLPTNFENISDNHIENAIKVYANKKIGYLYKNFILTKKDGLVNWKLFTPKAVGSGNSKTDWIKPILGEPNSVCTETYVMIGPFKNRDEAENVAHYINTKFFHFLLSLKKNTQDCLQKSFIFIPIQDFSKPWTDKELYEKYNLTKDEIAFIENMVRPEIGV